MIIIFKLPTLFSLLFVVSIEKYGPIEKKKKKRFSFALTFNPNVYSTVAFDRWLLIEIDKENLILLEKKDLKWFIFVSGFILNMA